MQHMKGIAAVAVLLVVLPGCTDDRVALVRGPLGPSRYEVRVTASGEGTDLDEDHSATLRVDHRSAGARFTLRTPAEVVTADLTVLEDGSVDVRRVRGASVEGSGQTELASLAGQLTPPLPSGPVRLGDSWSSTQRISTRVLSSSLRTRLRMVRFRRIAGSDAAELAGEVTGRLRVTDATRVLSGELSGSTTIIWAVRTGRVAAADTELVWTLSDGSRVTLRTSVTPD